jgi:hypothetical protein
MPISPAFARVQNFDVPTYPNIGARVDPSVFSNLASLGESIGNRREQDAIAGIMAGATDDKGNLDLNKAATALALSGRDPIKYINALTLQRGELSREAANKASEAYHNALIGLTQQQRDIQKAAEERARQQFEEGETKIDTGGVLRPPGVYRVPRGGTGAPTFTPFPNAPGVGPQSAIEPSQQLALPLEPNPEEAPPYQVAGPPMPPPTQPATPAPSVEITRAQKATPDFDEKYLAMLPNEAARNLVRGIATYKIDPNTFTGKDREDLVGAATLYTRGAYDQTEFQKRQTPPGAEVQSRIGLGKAFLDKAPNLRARIESGELSGPQGKTLAMISQGGPGELRRAIDEGSEALLRGLTGAGMNMQEQADYKRRYGWNVLDTQDTSLRKLNELETALRYVSTEVGKGRGGEDMLKDFRSKFGQEVVPGPKKVQNDAEVNALVGQGKAALDAAPTPEARASAVAKVHRILKDRGVPPQYWPQ